MPVTGGYYRGGLAYWLSEMSYIALFPVIAHFTMNKVWMMNRAHGYTTPADFYDDRFRSPVLRVLLALVFLVSSFPYIASVLISIGQAASIATGGAMNYQAVIAIVGTVIVLYVMLGGMKSVALTDTLQGLLFISLLWVIVIACLVAGFGGSLPRAVNSIWENTREWFSYPGPDGWVPYSSRLGYPLSCAIGWTIMLPHVFVRSDFRQGYAYPAEVNGHYADYAEYCMDRRDAHRFGGNRASARPQHGGNRTDYSLYGAECY